VAICSNSIRYYPDLMLATALGIPNRVSFVHKGMSGLVTHPVAIEFPSPYAAYFRAIVASTTGLPADWSLRPQVFPHDDAAREADAVMEGLSPDLPVVACVLTTRQKHGNWPASFVVDVLRECRQGIPFRVAFCGSTGDLPALTAFASQYPYENAIVAGKLSILGFASFLARCRALVTLDSGPRHLGNAAGIPVVFARNLSHSQVEAGRYCDSETDIAPAGEYLTDQEIARVAAASSSAAAAHKLRQALAG
jgi:ADP-heptose:LPS heptosyltransferase